MSTATRTQQTKDELAAQYTELRERLGLPYPYTKAVNTLTIKHLKHMIEECLNQLTTVRIARELQAEAEKK